MPNPTSDAKQKLRDLDRSYREFLGATNHVQNNGTVGEQIAFAHAFKRRFARLMRDVKAIQNEFPNLLTNLEGKYRGACTGELLGTKSKWPKADSSTNLPSAEDLVNFALEEALTLEGEALDQLDQLKLRYS